MKPPNSGAKTKKNIAMVAHDQKKSELLQWSGRWLSRLQGLKIYATGTTGRLLEQTHKLDVTCLNSGPLGGDQQIGALITEGKIDYLIFFWDPLMAQPHDTDVKALLRLAVLHNIPTACNLSSADFIISSAFLDRYYPKGINSNVKKKHKQNVVTLRPVDEIQ